MPVKLAPPYDSLDIHASEAMCEAVSMALTESKAVLEGHFALHRTRHASRALRFRGIGRNPSTLKAVVDALDERLPDSIASQFPRAKVLSPESAGFFLGNEIARRKEASLVICQTDMRRLPTKALLSGTIEPNDRVVLVNDVAGTGASISALRELVAERKALLVGVILFGVVQPEVFRRDCERLGLPAHWLVTAKWPTHTPEVDCPGCKARAPLLPVAEFA